MQWHCKVCNPWPWGSRRAPRVFFLSAPQCKVVPRQYSLEIWPRQQPQLPACMASIPKPRTHPPGNTLLQCGQDAQSLFCLASPWFLIQELLINPGTHHFASGDMIIGWSQMKVGLMHVSSRNSPTSLSSSRAAVRGGGQLISCSFTCRQASCNTKVQSHRESSHGPTISPSTGVWDMPQRPKRLYEGVRCRKEADSRMYIEVKPPISLQTRKNTP